MGGKGKKRSKMDGKKWKEIREKRKEIRAENEKNALKRGRAPLKREKGGGKWGRLGAFLPPNGEGSRKMGKG